MKANILEFIILINCLSIRKIWNYFLIYFSFYCSRLIRKSVVNHYPFSIAIEPTTACNLSCPQCPSGINSFTRQTGTLKIDDYYKMIRKLPQQIFYMIFYFQGEPFIHKDIYHCIEEATKRNIFTMTSTNGHFLNENNSIKILKSGLKKLIISVDGVDEKSYVKYRVGGDFKKVIDGIKTIVRQKKLKKSIHPIIELQFIVFKHNEGDIEKIKKLGKSLGVDRTVIKTAQIYNSEDIQNWLPKENKFRRYKSRTDKLRSNKKLYNHCFKLWSSMQVTWNGDVVPCCYDKDATYIVGNLVQEDFNKIWFNSAEITKFRNQVLKNRKSQSICCNCSEGTSFVR